MQESSVALQVLAYLRKRYPKPATNLHFRTPWELLVATVLSAQCTDARVNLITPKVFATWPSPKDMAQARIVELEAAIKSCGFYHNKAKNLKACAKRIVETFAGEVPKNLDDLLSLPGVARKTANCVLFGAFGINAGLAVDTHVKRISFRLGLTQSKQPETIEQDLLKLFPQEEWVA
ncbi:MAG: endonuclease III [Desulfovibrionaceae bacterium]|nr:endonuclease III [Desulfovibrionaceae bacterium]